MDLSDAIKEAYEYAPPDVTYYDTLEIASDGFTDSIRVVRSHESLETPQGEFLPCWFDFSLPETEGAVRGQMKITVNFLPKSAQQQLIAASRAPYPVTVKYRQYLGADRNPDAELPLPLTLTGIEQTPSGVTGTALFSDLQNALFPRRLMTTTELPGGRI